MKFRILEKRGKFRIEYKSRQIQYDSPMRFGRVRNRDVHLRWTPWKVEPNRCELVKKFDPWSDGTFEVHPEIEFDTYKQAEAYIKKHYGLEGVKAIEEPEWRQV